MLQNYNYIDHIDYIYNKYIIIIIIIMIIKFNKSRIVKVRILYFYNNYIYIILYISCNYNYIFIIYYTTVAMQIKKKMNYLKQQKNVDDNGTYSYVLLIISVTNIIKHNIKWLNFFPWTNMSDFKYH